MITLDTKASTAEPYPFMAGGGEMGRLMRAKDWSGNNIGTPDKWPQSLRTTLSILLNSKFPMFLWWGPELICFYNDAYRPSLGENGKHPFILGEKAKEAWTEIWDIIKPLIDQVLTNGEATWSEDQLIPIYRNGNIEDVYWTFSYSPVNDESGKVTGVLVICSETTEKVNTFKNLEENNQRYLNDIMQAPVAMCVFRGKNHTVEIANGLMLELWGKTAGEVINKPVFVGVPEARGQGLEPLIDNVFNTGEKFVANERPINLARNGKIETTYVNFVWKPLKDTDGAISGIVAIASEVTEQVIARKKVEDAEERLRLAAEATELSTWDLDLQTRKIIHSPRLAEIFGHDKLNILSHPEMRSQIHPDDIHEVVEKAFDMAMQTGIYKYEARVVKPNNAICWIRTQGKVFYDEKNQPVKLIGTLRDITEEKYHQQVLLESEQKFRLLADSMPQFIWTGDAGGNLNYFNQSVYNYSGLTQEQIAREGWIQIVHPDDREENIKRWLHSVGTGNDFLFEHRFRRKDGEYRWQLSRAIPQKDAFGTIQMWVGTSTDIQEIKELDQQKDYFISMASHELKTPITSIKGYVQMMESRYSNSADTFLTSSLRIIDKQIVTLTNLISDLLDLSKIKSGSLILTKEYFPVDELIKEIIDEIEHINPGYNFIFSGETAINLAADRERIGQVLRNLLTNAVKYSPVSRVVKVTNLIKDNNVLISVEDFGIGISKNDQQRIFERFYRVEGKNEKTFPGFGIGLFISAEIINRHNGKIGVESEPGKGSVFCFMLPLNG